MWEIEDLGNGKYMLKFGETGFVFPISYGDLKLIVDAHNEVVSRLEVKKNEIVNCIIKNSFEL